MSVFGRAGYTDCISELQPVDRAADAVAALVEHMGVDHGRAHVFVTQKLLDGANVVARFEQVGSEGVAEGVAADALGDAGLAYGVLDRPLQERFVEVVAPLLAGLGVCPSVLLGKDPLPAPFGRGVGIFAVEGGR